LPPSSSGFCGLSEATDPFEETSVLFPIGDGLTPAEAWQLHLTVTYNIFDHLRELGLRAAELRPLEKVALTQIDDYRKRASGTKQN
jgi:hypothetical protein